MNKRDALQWCAVNIKTWPKPDENFPLPSTLEWRVICTEPQELSLLGLDDNGPFYIYKEDWKAAIDNSTSALSGIILDSNSPAISAASILSEASAALSDRAAERDTPEGERSMGKTVAAFNAMFGHALTEEQGWQFMELLKMARSAGGKFRLDDYADGAAYAALTGECAAAARSQNDRVFIWNQQPYISQSFDGAEQTANFKEQNEQ